MEASCPTVTFHPTCSYSQESASGHFHVWKGQSIYTALKIPRLKLNQDPLYSFASCVERGNSVRDLYVEVQGKAGTIPTKVPENLSFFLQGFLNSNFNFSILEVQ